MLTVGFGFVKVFAGVVADRLLREVTVGAAVGAVAGLGGALLSSRLVTGPPSDPQDMDSGRGGGSRDPRRGPSSWCSPVRWPSWSRTAGGLKLAGWWIPSRNHAAVVLLHGSGSTREDVLEHAKVLVERLSLAAEQASPRRRARVASPQDP